MGRLNEIVERGFDFQRFLLLLEIKSIPKDLSFVSPLICTQESSSTSAH